MGAAGLIIVSQPGVLARPSAEGKTSGSALVELVEPDSAFHEGARWLAGILAVLGLVAVARTIGEGSRPRPAPPNRRPPPRVHPTPAATPAALAAEAERRGDHPRAASLYDAIHDWASAARCYEAAARAAQEGSRERGSFLQLFAQRSFAAGRAEVAAAALAELGDLRGAADLSAKAGDRHRQAEYLARAGDVAAAAAALVEAGDPAGAAQVLEAGGDVEGAVALLAPRDARSAARMCEKHGLFARAAELYAGIGDADLAAQLYLHAGDGARAAQVFREAGDLDSAAEQLAANGALAEAADLWLDLGQPERAAQAFQTLGDPGGLARAFERRGDFASSAREFLKLGKSEEAIRVVALLPPEKRDVPAVRLLLGAAQLKLGRSSDAAATVRPVVSRGGAETRLRCEALYLLGLAAQQGGDIPQAVTCFEQCLALDHGFRDAPLRLSQLRNATPPPGQLSASTILPRRYLLVSKIGEGAMGTVYKAKDSVLDRVVALKVLNRALSDNETARSYFLREARAAAALSNPHIVTVHDAGFEGAVLFLVMEFLDGEDLESLSMRVGGLPERTALRYAAQVSDALAAVHAQNIVHRDVKPGNVMLLKGGDSVKLMDFGIAHLASSGGSRRKITNVAGTPDFMAPEQLVGQGLGPWTDIYALGGTLYELLTGQVPFPEGDPAAMNRDPPPDPRRLKPDLRVEVADLVRGCLTKEPRARPQSATSLRARLEQLAVG